MISLVLDHRNGSPCVTLISTLTLRLLILLECFLIHLEVWMKTPCKRLLSCLRLTLQMLVLLSARSVMEMKTGFYHS